jgi:hypothetical protein
MSRSCSEEKLQISLAERQGALRVEFYGVGENKSMEVPSEPVDI